MQKELAYKCEVICPITTCVYLFWQGHQLVTVLETHGSSGGVPNANSNTNNNSISAGSGSKMPPLIRDLLTAVDDKEWQHSLFNLLQNQTYNQCEVDLFELLCKVLDQNLFAQVDWARNSVFFKDLKVSNFLPYSVISGPLHFL